MYDDRSPSMRVIANRDYASDKGVIQTLDDKEFNNYHHYRIVSNKLDTYGHNRKVVGEIEFQKGPIQEVGINGLTERDLLEILKNRLENFQASEYRSDYNEHALKHIRQAIEALDARTADRTERGVEGTNNI